MSTLAATTPKLDRKKHLRSIAVFTDFSPSSKAALRYAAEIAKAYSAEIRLIHALVPMIPSYAAMDLPVIYVPEVEESQRSATKKRLESMMKQPWMAGVDHESIVWCGSIKQILADDFDLIVMATSGHTGIGKSLMGSNAESTFRSAKVPVLTVGPHSRHYKGGAIFKNILYATDFSAHSNLALAYALALSEQFKSHLTLLHVLPEDGFSFDRAMARQKPLDEMERITPPQFSKRCSRIVNFGSAAHSILKEAATSSADLIVMGARGAGAGSGLISHFGGGVAYEVAAKAPCPVLTIRH